MFEKMEEVSKQIAATTIQRQNEGKPFAIVDGDYKAIDLEKFLPAPITTERKVNVSTEASFIDYFNRFALENSAVFLNPDTTSITGVIDYDDKLVPAWGKHVVHYNCPLSKEWHAWIKGDRVRMNQVEFAEFVENNLRDFITPNGASMLELATKFNVVRKATFGSAIRLNTGEMQFQFSEENQKGTVEVPEKFSLGLSPFKDGQRYSIEARLRYRLNEGSLRLWYELIDADRVLEDAFADIAGNIKKSIPETTLTVYGAL